MLYTNVWDYRHFSYRRINHNRASVLETKEHWLIYIDTVLVVKSEPRNRSITSKGYMYILTTTLRACEFIEGDKLFLSQLPLSLSLSLSLPLSLSNRCLLALRDGGELIRAAYVIRIASNWERPRRSSSSSHWELAVAILVTARLPRE